MSFFLYTIINYIYGLLGCEGEDVGSPAVFSCRIHGGSFSISLIIGKLCIIYDFFLKKMLKSLAVRCKLL